MDISDPARFDQWAPRYDRSLLQLLLFGPTHAAVLEAAGHWGGPPHEILDLGCGTGRLLELAAQRWSDAQLVGVDNSARMVAEARQKHRGPRYRFEVADAAALPLPPDSVDLVLSTISFHHWADQAGGVREATRVLRRAGLFILADMRPPPFLRAALRMMHGRRSRERLFAQAGLTVIGERTPLRLAGSVLITVGRKA